MLQVAFVLFGFFLFFLPAGWITEYYEIKSWSSAPAVVEKFTHGNRRCNLIYRYTVEDREYEGNRIAIVSSGVSTHGRQHQCRMLARHELPEKGDIIQVKYDPDDPARSVYLDSFPTLALWSILGFSGVVFLLARSIKNGKSSG